ncbi:MAG: hypothetical protein ACFFBH_07580 [Promethearchaeota archaeon]
MSSKLRDQTAPLIIDIGTSNSRIGWAGDDFPDIVAPSVYVDVSDYLFTSDVIEGLEELFLKKEQISHLVGHQALKYQNILKVHEFKKENNFNILLKFFLYYYKQLKIDDEYQFKQPLVILSPFFISDLEKSKLQDLFFNSLKFPSILFLNESQAILSTLQKDSGVIVSMGESHTYISTIFHGFTNIMAKDVFPIAGKDLTNYFLNLILTRISTSKNIYIDKPIAKEIKEKLSLCVLNPQEEQKRVKSGFTKYDRVIDLPDGSNLKINLERFLLSEPLFNPKLAHIDYIDLGEAISKVIKTWERENWEELLTNIILSGGGSLITGLDQRIRMELQKHFSEKLNDKIKVIAASGRENMGWIGASILYTKGKLDKGWIDNPDF